ncbi:MAG: hypothetical protein R3D68_04420 [Hyphomicrobiaceae bacterium]
MSSSNPEIEPALDTEREYRAIEAALLETARGRWFLAEHSRRSRRIDTEQLESAIDQLKASLRDPPAILGRLRTELDQISELLAATRDELLSRRKLGAATYAAPLLPHEVERETLTPTAQLLRTAEELHETIWALQSHEVDSGACERIGRSALSILALSARQAQESERTVQFTEALETISRRISAALETIFHETNETMSSTIDAEPLPHAAHDPFPGLSPASGQKRRSLLIDRAPDTSDGAA